MKRREFLGSVIGTLVGSRLPFRAVPAPGDIVVPSRGSLYDYKLGFIAELTGPNGERRRVPCLAPSIENISAEATPFLHAVRFKAVPLKTVRPIVVQGVQLFTPQGRFISQTMFDGGPVTFLEGDTLRCEYRLSLPSADPHGTGRPFRFDKLPPELEKALRYGTV